jgi:hypothetical protein
LSSFDRRGRCKEFDEVFDDTEVVTMKSQGLALIATVAALFLGAAPAAPPTFTITLGGRTACVNPTTKHFARADGGSIDVQGPGPGVLVASLCGSVAANAYLGHTGSAVESFQLVQEFEIACSDSSVSAVALTLDSSLVGFVRSKYKGGACVQVASATVTSAGLLASPLSIAYPPMCVAGTEARLCNQHTEPITGRSLPLGKYVLTAELVIEAEASGLCDGHSAADFSPTAALPADFVRLRDPFQNVDKKNFGLSITLTAAPADGPVTVRPPADKKVVRTIDTAAQPPRPTVNSPVPTAFERARAPFYH